MNFERVFIFEEKRIFNFLKKFSERINDSLFFRVLEYFSSATNKSLLGY